MTECCDCFIPKSISNDYFPSQLAWNVRDMPVDIRTATDNEL